MRVLALAGLAFLLAGAAGSEPEKPNGFDLDGLRVPRKLLVTGGPARDQIPSVDEPVFVSPEDATWVGPGTPVIGVELDGVAHVYPVHLMEYHQIVNDDLAGIPVAVTFDPLTATPMAFRRRLGSRTLSFGVSGLLYNSNFLLYDRETESLWCQMTGEAVAGPLAGRRLERVPSPQAAFLEWLQRAPSSRVLARPAPRRFDYRASPYTSYWVQDEILFPVAAKDPSYHAKEVVLGVRVGDHTRAYLGSIVTGAGGVVDDRFQGKRIRFQYRTEDGLFRYDPVPGVEFYEAYWFAWKAFHPDTDIWTPAEEKASD